MAEPVATTEAPPDVTTNENLQPGQSTPTAYCVLTPDGTTALYDRVTYVLKRTEGNEGLMAWYGKEERAGILDLLAAGLTQDQLRQTLGVWPFFATLKRDEAGNAGTAVHLALKARLLKEPAPGLSPAQQEHLDKALGFLASAPVTVTGTEVFVCCHTAQVAGTKDIDGTWNGQPCILDLKTGGLYRSAARQLAWYALLQPSGHTLLDGLDLTPAGLDTRELYTRLRVYDWPVLGVLHTKGKPVLKLVETPWDLAFEAVLRLVHFRSNRDTACFHRVWPKETAKLTKGD